MIYVGEGFNFSRVRLPLKITNTFSGQGREISSIFGSLTKPTANKIDYPGYTMQIDTLFIQLRNTA